MFIQVTKVHKGAKTYKYAKIVESCRRKSDGQPTHRVVANIGAASDLLIENLRAAFRAEAAGAAVVLPTPPVLPPGIRAFAYLDVALCLEFWDRLGLGSLLDAVIPRGALDVSVRSVVAALVAHRCTAPGSKLSAQTWFPRTALPELLGVFPDQFNNARLHRALTLLEKAGPALQTEHARRLSARPGGFKALYLDVTDTWFVGLGPDRAEKRKTKEGLWRRKIGIVLLCDYEGFPIRWQVVGGRRADNGAMTDLARDLKNVAWLSGIPVACDRAMGKPRTLRRLEDAGVHYVTMLTSDGFPAFTDGKIPAGVANAVHVDAEDAVAQADAAAERAGMVRVRDRMRALDLGVRTAVRARPEVRTHRDPPAHAKRLSDALEVRAARAAGETRDAVAARLGLSPGTVSRIADLLRLTSDLREAVDRGEADALSFEELRRISKLPEDEQHAVFDAERAVHCDGETGEEGEEGDDDDDPAHPPPSARVIITFNPAAFVRARQGARAMRERLDTAIAELNRSLGSVRSKRTPEAALVEAARVVRKFDATDVFDVEVTARPGTLGSRPLVSLTLKQDIWDQHRGLDGFGVLVAHPALAGSADDLVRTYSDKNKIEEDFHVIKSVVDVRPVFHRTDAKVDAHVTLCMLALTVARGLERAVGGDTTASRILEELGSVKLLRLSSTSPALHAVSDPTEPQRALVARLTSDALLDTATLAKRMHIVAR